VLLRRGAALALLGASAGVQAPPPPAREAGASAFRIEHSPPGCLLAEKTPRLVACLQPRSQRAALRVLFRAEGDVAWYASPLRSDVPCYTGLLPRPSRSLGRVVYVVEAAGPEGRTRTAEFTVPVFPEAAACDGRPAPVAASGRATWEAPPGAPRTPAGFEGARPPAHPSTASVLPPPPESSATTKPATRPPPGTSSTPTTPPRAPPPGVPPLPATREGGGHGLRNTAIVVGTAAAGGAAVALTRQDEGGGGSPPTGSGLPPTGVSGVYVGTETVNYPGGCVGTDDVVLNLQEASGALSGILTFTVRSCPCCASGRGANPVSGALSGTRLQLTTPTGFIYSGSFAGVRLSGSLAAPGGVNGTWTVDKR
jgi:hypothetical protein